MATALPIYRARMPWVRRCTKDCLRQIEYRNYLPKYQISTKIVIDDNDFRRNSILLSYADLARDADVSPATARNDAPEDATKKELYQRLSSLNIFYTSKNVK